MGSMAGLPELTIEEEEMCRKAFNVFDKDGKSLGAGDMGTGQCGQMVGFTWRGA